MTSIAASLDRFFRITERNSDIGTEIRGGIITFLSMAYILTVNPLILNDATGVSWNALFASTALAAVFACLLMGLYARFPVALAPGMGLNTFLGYTICLQMNISYSNALFCVFISGVVFFIMSVSGARMKMMESFPSSLKLSFTAGIGTFIAITGLFNSNILIHGTGTALSLGDLSEPNVLLAIFAIAITLALCMKVKGAVLIGIVVTAIVGIIFGLIKVPSEFISSPDMSLIGTLFSDLGNIKETDIGRLAAAIFALFIMDMFDTAGTLIAISERSGGDKIIDPTTCNRAFETDSVGTMVGAVIGTSTTTAFIESCTGVEEGARTGLMAVTVGVMFLIALFFAPVFGIITNACIAGALVFVGIMMFKAVKGIQWDNMADCITAFITIILIGLSGSITNGIALGIITYVCAMTISGKYKEVNPIIWILAALLTVYLIVSFGPFIN